MTYILLQLLALYLGSLPVCAQTVGATNLLTRGPGAEAAALGDSVVSTVHDPTALYWNPAGLARAGGMVGGEHLFLYGGARYDFVGLSVPSALGTFGLGALQLNRDNITARSAIDDPGTSVSNTQSDYLAGFARMLGEHFAAGGAANILRFNLAGNQGMGVGLDLGGQAFLPADDMLGIKQPFWSFGALVKNLVPPRLRLLQDAETFPRELRGGVSLSFRTLSRVSFGSGVIHGDRMTASLSFRKVGGEPALHPGLGLSYCWDNLLVLRTGYANGGFTGGFGLRTVDGRFNFDYALEDKPLSMNHRFTVSYRFLEPKSPALASAPEDTDQEYAKARTRARNLSEEHYLRGQKVFKDLRYGESLEPLRLARLLDPGNKEKAVFYGRALEVARRQKLRDLSEDKDKGLAAGDEAKVYRAIARLLDLQPPDRAELMEILRRVMARMQPADLASTSAAVLEARRPEILRFSSQGLASEALALAANLEVSASSSTAEAVAQLKAQVSSDARDLRSRLEAGAAGSDGARAPGKALRALLALRRAFPDDPALAARIEATRDAAASGTSLTLRERLYLRRLYYLAAVQYANRNMDGAKDLLEEVLRRDPADADAAALEDAMARGTLIEDQLQKEE